MKLLTRLFVPIVLGVAGSAAAIAAPAQTTLTVEHMSCASCPVIVKSALSNVDGVDDVHVSLLDKTVKVKFDDAQVTAEGLAQVVSDAGFPAKVNM